MRAIRLTLAGAIIAAIAGAGVWLALPPDRVEWDRLQSGVTITAPPGDGPFPVVLMLHGCGGVRPFLQRYVDAAVEAGAAAVVLDSFAPRGIGRARAVISVCIGADLRGGARAHDIDLVLDNLRDPRLDMDRVTLAGWSHGAWSVAEKLTEGPAERGVTSAFLVYPYCRFPARWPGRRPAEGVRVLAVVPSLDAVGDARACRAALERSGAEVVRIENATHAFEEEYAIPFPFRHNEEAFAANAARFGDFIRDTLVAPAAADTES